MTDLRLGETVAVISDVHAPWQDNEALDLALLVAKKCSITTLVMLGDMWDASGASAWRKNPFIPLLFNQERRIARKIYEIWHEEFPDIPKKAVPGNHELRIPWALQSLPERFRWISQVTEISWHSLLGLGQPTTMAPVWELDIPDHKLLELYHGWQAVGTGDLDAVDIMHLISKIITELRGMKPKQFPALPYDVVAREPEPALTPFSAWPSQEILAIGKLAFFHGHEIKMNSLAVHVAYNILRRIKENAIVAHYHRVGAFLDKNLHGNDIGVFLNPCLCLLEQYAFRPAWQRGLSIVDFTKSGHFCVQPVVFMQYDDTGLFGMLGRNIFTSREAPVRHRKLPPVGMLAQMLPIPTPQEML